MSEDAPVRYEVRGPVAVVTMDREESVAGFESGPAEIPEVIHAERLFGEPDYFIRAVTADIAAFQRLRDERLARLLRRCQQLPGQKLFQYLDDDGVPRPIGSGDVNDYLREACGEDFTAKDFRTWGGTLAAIKAFVRNPPPEGASERALAMLQNAAVAEVAQQLGNTPAVCRASYIHPRVFEGWRDGSLARAIAESDLPHPRKLERLALDFLGHQRPRQELH